VYRVRVEGQTKDSGFGNVLRLETRLLTSKLETASLTDTLAAISLTFFVRTQALREKYELELFHDRRTLVVVWKVKSRFRSKA